MPTPSSRLRSRVGPALALCVCLASASVARAHISLEQGGTHKSRYGDGSIKQGPCGVRNGARGTNVYTYAPGQTISVAAVEFVTHPGYFRIAFDDDGDDAFIDPRSIPGAPPSGRTCANDGQDQCGQADFDNAPGVLADDLNPHVTTDSSAPKYTWSVQLPDIECEHCTLQLIQVMTDKPPYVPGSNDIYYQCIDLVLRKGAVSTGPASTAGRTAEAPAAGDSGSSGSTPAASDDGGCSIARVGVERPRAQLATMSALAVGLGMMLRRRARWRARANDARTTR